MRNTKALKNFDILDAKYASVNQIVKEIGSRMSIIDVLTRTVDEKKITIKFGWYST